MLHVKFVAGVGRSKKILKDREKRVKTGVQTFMKRIIILNMFLSIKGVIDFFFPVCL